MTTRVKGILIIGPRSSLSAAAVRPSPARPAARAKSARTDAARRPNRSATRRRSRGPSARRSRPSAAARSRRSSAAATARGGYEVEIDRRDGSSVEVNVDPDGKVVSVAKDD